MAELRASYLITADTRAARANVVGLKDDTEQLGGAVRKLGADGQTGATGLSAIGTDAGTAADNVIQLVRVEGDLAAALTRSSAAVQAFLAVQETGEAAIRSNASAITSQIAALDGLDTASRAAARAHLEQATALDAIRTKYDPLYAASRQYELQLAEIAEAERQGALSAAVAGQARERAALQLSPAMRAVGRDAQNAAAYTTQLGFQAQDTFMMIVSGQAPLMTAMQQGTQVVGVFQMMRDQGLALGPAIRGSLLSMVSPLSLVTLGVIALGSYAIQAFMATETKAESAEDAVVGLTGSVRDFGGESKRTAADIVADFGSINPVLVEMQRNLTALSQTRSLLELRQSFKALKGELSGDFLNTSSQDVAELLGVEAYRRDMPSKVASAPVARFQKGLRDLQTADGPSSQLEVVRRLAQQLVVAAGGIDQMNAAQLAYYDSLIATEGAIERIVAAQAQAQRQAIDLARAAGTENTRMGGPTVVDITKPKDSDKGFQAARDLLGAGREELELARLKLAYGEQSAEVRAEEARQANAAVEAKIRELNIGRESLQAEQLRGQEAVRQALAEAARVAAARNAYDQMLAQHQQEARIVQLTAQYGADSLEVAYARAAAEREVMAAQIEAQGYTGQAAADLLDAWDAARGVASVNMAAGIGAAAAEAQLLASMMGVSLGHAVALMGLAGKAAKPAGAPGRLSFGSGGSAADGLLIGDSAGLSWGDNPGSHMSTADLSRPTTKTPKGGGAKKEADALAELIQREREQIAALRTLDPVQAEILKNHDALKDATDAEKRSVADLIAERMRLEEIRDRLDQIGETGRNAFQQLLTGATSLGGALAMVLDKLAEMLASDAWDMIWGGGRSGGGLNLGGLLGGLFGLGGGGGTGAYGLPMPFADGGRVPGVGGPREDNIAAWLSVGEFVVNAPAARRAMPLLEAINAGVPMDHLMDVVGGKRLPAFADGGLVGSSAPRAWRLAGSDSGGGANAAAAIGSGRQDRLAINIHLDSQLLRAEIRETSAPVAIEASQRTVESWSSRALPQRLREIDAEPRRIG